MFAHQVVDDLMNGNNDVINKDVIISWIRNSHKFHIPAYGDIEHLNLRGIGKSRLFLDDAEYLKFPYELCWFDCYHSEIKHFKYGTLVSYKNEYNELFFIPFIKHNTTPWMIDPVGIHIKIGKMFPNQNSNIKSLRLKTSINYSIFDQDEYIQNNLRGQLSHIELVLRLINCKNIGTEKNYPSEALNKKRLKTHKQPLFTYHTLVLKPVGKKQESIPRHLWNNRIHLCRGHFKTYTQDNPLFGRITGRFWWQPAVRGRNRNGIVMKDYQVAPAPPLHHNPSTIDT